MGDYIKLISKEKKNIYVPKKVAQLSEELPFEEVPFEILEVLVSYLNTKYFYEQMKEIRPSYNEPYPIPENLSLDVNIIFYLIFRLSRSFYNN